MFYSAIKLNITHENLKDVLQINVEKAVAIKTIQVTTVRCQAYGNSCNTVIHSKLDSTQRLYKQIVSNMLMDTPTKVNNPIM